MSVWVEIGSSSQNSKRLRVTLHVSVWVEIRTEKGWHRSLGSRSTWACELKYAVKWVILPIGGSRSTWACELKWLFVTATAILLKSRSTWACELKWRLSATRCWYIWVTLHVSVWVEMNPRQKLFKLRFVTLHVSVWVEMKWKILKTAPTMSRSTWACELKSLYSFRPSATCFVTLHVSVWVEIWLFVTGRVVFTVTLHVSVWVEMSILSGHFSTRPVTLHVSVWVEIVHHWCCQISLSCHAPRERVSWNVHWFVRSVFHTVTLHVSVWVEIVRVSLYALSRYVTLHVSVWVEMFVCVMFGVLVSVTLHVSVWVEM